jgi:RING finger/CHY zinc finger protein 1
VKFHVVGLKCLHCGAYNTCRTKIRKETSDCSSSTSTSTAGGGNNEDGDGGGSEESGGSTSSNQVIFN